MTDREKLFINITRDADKIDILLKQLNTKYKEDYIITDDVMTYIFNKKLLPNNYKEYETISRLREIAFVFDINYKKSFEMIKKSNIMNKKLDIIYEAINDENVLKIKDFINSYIEERIR